MHRSTKTARSGRRETSLLRALNARSLTGNPRGAKLWAEDESVFRHHLEYLDLAADTTRSTIAVAFSSDGKLLASTHGDHTVKITSFLRGRVLQTLRGHPRTPWTVKFHPKDPSIVASGCLDYEVRVWNVSTGRCLHSSKLGMAIISLSFHPSGHVLAIASGLSVYLWDYKNTPEPYAVWSHPHTLRCVRFTPDGTGIIVGAANNGPPRTRTNNGGPRGAARRATGQAPAPAREPGQAEVTFRLQVWDFSLDAALAEHGAAAMTRPRVILHQALLYNDGGFDVSQDGLWLCAIAELWKVASDPGVAAAAAAAAAVVAAHPSSPSPAARARDGAAITAVAAETGAAAGAAGDVGAAAHDGPRDGLVRSTGEADSAEAAAGGVGGGQSSFSPFSSAAAAATAVPGAGAGAATTASAAGDVATGGGDASLTITYGRERPGAAVAPAAGFRVVAGGGGVGGGEGGGEEEKEGRRDASLRLPRCRGQGDAPHVESRQWELALPAPAGVGTKMEVEMEGEMSGGKVAAAAAAAGEKGKGAEVVARGWAERYAATAAGGCDESGGGKERDLSAPRHGSQLGRDRQPLFVGVAATVAAAATASPSSPSQTLLAGATAAAATECRAKARGEADGVDSSGGQKHTEGGGGASLAPWPSRVRPRRYFSGAGEHDAWGEQAGDSGVVVTGGAGGGVGVHQARQRGVGHELSPKTPSPRITLKRRLSSPWCSSAGSRSGSGSEGFLGRKRQGMSVPKAGTVGRVVGSARRARPDSGRAGAGSGGVGGDRSGCHSPAGLEARAAASGEADEEEEEEEEEEKRRSPPRDIRGGVGSEFRRQERDRPPPLPPPPIGSANREPSSYSSSLSSSPSSSSSALPLLSASSAAEPWRPPPPPPVSAAPLSESLQASSFPLPATSWGRGGASSSSPPSSPPAAAAAALLGSAAAVDGGHFQLQAGAAEGEAGRRGRGGWDTTPAPPPAPAPAPVFFLQVPGGVAAATSEEGLCSPLSGATATAAAEAPPVAHHGGRQWGVGAAGGDGEEGNAATERGVGSQRFSGGEGGRCGSGSGNSDGGSGSGRDNGNGAGRFEQPPDGGIPRAFSSGDGRCRELLLPPPPLPPPSPPVGKFVPHLVLVSLNAEGRGERAARVVRAAEMDNLSAKQVTSVKLSPSARYILLGAGVLSERTRQEPRRVASSDGPGGGGGGSGGGVATPRAPPVTSIYSASDLQPVNLMPTADDDVNIACFHPEPGMGCVYGTKQGRVSLVRMAD